jgi:hypothetical protein
VVPDLDKFVVGAQDDVGFVAAEEEDMRNAASGSVESFLLLLLIFASL